MIRWALLRADSLQITWDRHHKVLWKPVIFNVIGLLFIADSEKAFHKVRWEFLKLSLSYFNFGGNRIHCVETLYNPSSSRLINNGFISDGFQKTQGVCQGCSSLPYLFLICIGILAINVRNNSKILDLRPNEREIKLTMYADDANFFL